MQNTKNTGSICIDVLPFENLSDRRSDDYFSRGVVEDLISDHLAQSLGIGRQPRKLKAPADRARAAVTWRIRSAIRKIEAVHPSLGSHLANSIRTGTFCCYSPEKGHEWHL